MRNATQQIVCYALHAPGEYSNVCAGKKTVTGVVQDSKGGARYRTQPLKKKEPATPS